MIKRGDIYKAKLQFEIWIERADLNCLTLKQDQHFIVVEIKTQFENKLKLTHFIILISNGIFRTSSWIDVANFEKCIQRIS